MAAVRVAAVRVAAVLLVAYLLGAGGASAQAAGRRPFAILGPDQGLPSGVVLSMVQDEDGFIWMGTEHGLIRYEGGRSRLWGTADGLPSAFVSRVVAAPGGGLWVATQGGLVRLLGRRVEPAILAGTPSRENLGLIAADANRRVWAVTREGLFVQRSGLQFDARPWTRQASVFALTAGASGTMYLAGSRGVEAFYPDGSAETWGVDAGLPRGGATVAIEDGAGRVWAGSGRSLAVKPRGAARFEDRSSLLGAGLSPNSTPLLDKDGSVWLPALDGALHIAGERVERIDSAAGLPFRWVRSVFRDREDTLWVTGPGTSRLLGAGRLWNYGAPEEVTWAVVRDRDGRLVVGGDDGAVRESGAGLVRIPGTEGRRVKAIAQDAAGTLWMVSTMGPATWLRPGRARAEEVPCGESCLALNAVLVDSHDQVWLGHARQGLLRWDRERKRAVQELAPAAAGVEALGVNAIQQDGSGRIWACSTSGLFVREAGGTWQFFTEKDGLQFAHVRGAAMVADGSAWLFYGEPRGLTRVTVSGGRLSVLERRTTANGLRSGMVYAATVDHRGNLWLTTEQGLDRLNPPLHVGREHGMASEDCAIQALMTEGDRVWVGTAGGLVRYDAEWPPRQVLPPRASIMEMSYGGRRMDPPFDANITLSHQESTVEFLVAAPSYAREHDLRFQVRLSGFEEQWRTPAGRASRYPALPGGHYQFEVRASSGDGAPGPVARFPFDVRPPAWQTWWAIVLYCAGGLLGMYGVVRLRVASLARAKTDLEHLVATRTGELRARNEELSAALGRVNQLSGLLPICASCKKIRDDRGYWNELEHYISDHSEADFSHGICPDCAKKLYPDYTS